MALIYKYSSTNNISENLARDPCQKAIQNLDQGDDFQSIIKSL